MGSFANTLFIILLGWLQGAVSAVWSAFTSENGTSFLAWIGRHWILLAGILCAAGLAADLCVYILRWKPFRVWKSFFTRGKGAEDTRPAEQAGDMRESGPLFPENRKPESSSSASGHQTTVSDRTEPDLSHWEREPEPEKTVRPAIPAVQDRPAVITNAGYVVPEDSPYRRPAAQQPVRPETGSAGAGRTKAASQESSGEPSSIPAPRRRRRISVSDLFSDPEEDIREFDAPQHIIDSRAAYHDPVYPRGWKKSEDEDK